MNKYLLLVSVMAVSVAIPALAAPNNTSLTFPDDEYMQPDYTYVGQANHTNMGIYSGSVDATPEYEAILYNIAAGQYLAAGGTSGTQCPENSFCPGLTNATYDADNPQGITACSTLDNGAYPNSAAGANADTKCYRACTTVDVAHSTGVTGNNYYGAGADTCAATGCVAGYSKVDGTGVDLNTLIGEVEADGAAAINNYGDDMNSNASDYGLTSSDKNTFVVDYGNKGVIRGHGRCSTRTGTFPWGIETYNVIPGNTVDTLADETGAAGAINCYCQLDTYTPSGGSAVSVSTPWVFMYDDYGDYEECADICIEDCGWGLADNSYAPLAFRADMFNRVESSFATCEQNFYNIAAGQYLAAGGTSGTQCPENSFCPGLTNATYDADNAQGITACPSEYPLSDAGSDSESDCYRECDVNDLPHSATQTGRYYSDGTKTCAVATCETGYSISRGASDISNDVGVNRAAINNSGDDLNMNASEYGLSTSDKNAFAVDFGANGVVRGHGRCSTRKGVGILNGAGSSNDITHFDELADETGQSNAANCYCQLDTYTSVGGRVQNLSTPWVYMDNIINSRSSNVHDCANYCANYCVMYLSENNSSALMFRSALMGAVEPEAAMCETNAITLNWGNTTSSYIESNNAATCLYNADLRTPRAATSVNGKIFKGWKSPVSDELLPANTVIANGCNYAKLGVYSGTVEMEGVYDDDENNEENKMTCDAGYYLPANSTECALCLANHYCRGITVAPSDHDAGIIACTDNATSPAGSTSQSDCGKQIQMRVGDDVLYLTSSQKTTPALAVRVDNKVYYAETSPVSAGEKSMHAGTDSKLKTKIDDVEYYIHDSTAE